MIRDYSHLIRLNTLSLKEAIHFIAHETYFPLQEYSWVGYNTFNNKDIIPQLYS